VGRAQVLLHLLAELRAAGRIPDVPTYLNSPMAIDATEIFCAHPTEHRLTDEQVTALSHGVTYVRTREESVEVTGAPGPLIAISASGMLGGGRVLHHLAALAPDHRNTILLVGYQAAGTRGEALANGVRRVKAFGEYLPVRAEVARIDTLAWLATCAERPRRVHVVHGEASAADALRLRLADELGWDAAVAGFGERVSVTARRPAGARTAP
jgi:metallo-beta-lactamase family protein